MAIQYCMPVIPSADIRKSLRFWVDGLGFAADHEMEHDGKLVGCMVHKASMFFWLNQRLGTPEKPENYEGVRFYWTPDDLHETREHLKQLGFEVSQMEDRDYGNREFFMIDDDGYSHCFGVAMENKKN